MNAHNSAAREAVAAKPCQNSANDVQTQARLDCKRIFGVAHPLDVIAGLNYSANTFFQLETLFKAIAADPGASGHIKRLAEIGAYVSSDLGNYVDSEHEQLRNAVQKGGAV